MRRQKNDEEIDEGMEQSAVKTGVNDSQSGDVKLKTAAPLHKTKDAVTGKGGGEIAQIVELNWLRKRALAPLRPLVHYHSICFDSINKERYSPVASFYPIT